MLAFGHYSDRDTGQLAKSFDIDGNTLPIFFTDVDLAAGWCCKLPRLGQLFQLGRPWR